MHQGGAVKAETLSNKRIVDTPEGPRTNQDHTTPWWLVEAIQRFGHIDIDPCSNPWSLVPAGIKYSLHEGQDGLVQPWWGVVFVNPPFNDMAPWLARAASLVALDEGAEALVLCTLAPERKWFKEAKYNMLACPPRRVAYGGAGNRPAFPSTLMYFGHSEERFIEWALHENWSVWTPRRTL